MRRRLAFLVLVGSLVWTAAAAANGPVFVVVPGASGAPSLAQAIRARIAADRNALAAVRRRQSRHAAQLRQAQQELVKSNDPFPSEDESDRLTQQLAADAAAASRLAAAIQELQVALRPVTLPAGFETESPAQIGAYAVTVAERYLGVRYLWGGNNPDDGFDCSGFVQYVYAQLGVKLPHYAASQYATTAHIDPADLEPGDLVFFEPRSDGPGHVGIYVGDGMFIEAPHTGDVVKLYPLATEMSEIGFVGASRPVA